jgi:CDP-diacylglycerol--glycerol-3-phosphate 3-phosphatidyltransferase
MAVKWMRVSINPRDFLYIPNILSLLRIVIIPAIIYSLTKDSASHRILTITLMIIAIISDGLDGYLARKLKKESALGKILDPVADKFWIGSVTIAVTILRDFPWWAMGFIIFRDLGILICGVLMIERWTVITSSNIWGKATSFFQAISVMAYAFELSFRSYPLTVALMFTGVSAISYAMEFYKLAKVELRKSG